MEVGEFTQLHRKSGEWATHQWWRVEFSDSGFGEFIEEQLGFGGQGEAAVGISVV